MGKEQITNSQFEYSGNQITGLAQYSNNYVKPCIQIPTIVTKPDR